METFPKMKQQIFIGGNTMKKLIALLLVLVLTLALNLLASLTARKAGKER